MRKNLYLCAIATILFTCFFLVGCAPSKRVIPSLQYHDAIGMSIPKKAHIYWVPGKQASHEIPPSAGYSGNSGLAGLIVNLMFTSVESQHRKSNPSQYVLEYGKADEAVFLTSLRDVLEQQHVFKSVDLTTDISKVNANDVLIKIYFKTTRVTVNSGYLIKLSVNLSIQTGRQPPYERTYLVQNDESLDGAFKSKGFLDKKTEVSQELLTLIINGIKQWYRGNK
ncbi:MAG: hypothetical protein WCH10_06750 [bacterium]